MLAPDAWSRNHWIRIEGYDKIFQNGANRKNHRPRSESLSWRKNDNMNQKSYYVNGTKQHYSNFNLRIWCGFFGGGYSAPSNISREPVLTRKVECSSRYLTWFSGQRIPENRRILFWKWASELCLNYENISVEWIQVESGLARMIFFVWGCGSPTKRYHPR